MNTLKNELNIHNAAEILNDNKAEEIILLDLSKIHSYLSSFLIATALSKTHLRKLANDLVHYFKKHNHYLLQTPHEKEFDSGWVVLDGGSFMVHIFLQEKREFYALEELWQEATKIETNFKD